MPQRPKKDDTGPTRIPPSEAHAEAVERIVPKKKLQIEGGDVVVVREPVPLVNPRNPARSRYRVAIAPTLTDGAVFNSFQHAASEGQQLANQRGRRLLYLEDGLPVLIADYRR